MLNQHLSVKNLYFDINFIANAQVNKVVSAMSEGVDPPDLTGVNDNNDLNVKKQKQFVDLNTNTENSKSIKNSRNRDSDDDASDYEMANKERSKKSKTLVEKMQRKTSFSLLKPSILDTNPFAILDPDANQNDLAGKQSNLINQSQFRNENINTRKKIVKQRIPPIVITKPFLNPKDAISNIQKTLKGKVSFKILREGYNVTLETMDDHDSLKEFLAKQKIPFYTYTTLDKKPVRLVLKGVHHTYTPEDITLDLSTQNVKAVGVQPMFSKGKVPMDMFIVNFEHGTKISELMKTVKYICYQSVSWQPFIKKDVGTQCRKCQRFGHAASNCGLEYRCVKCTHRHSPGDCPLEDDQPASCVNCNNNHPANYKKCSAYIKYTESLKKFQAKSGITKSNSKSSNNVNSYSDSSKVKRNLSYSQVVAPKKQQKESNNSLNFLSSEIDNLFNCSLTELLQKIQSFVPEYKKANDALLKKMMIIDFLSQFT